MPGQEPPEVNPAKGLQKSARPREFPEQNSKVPYPKQNSKVPSLENLEPYSPLE